MGTIKARRDYVDAISGEVVRVTGWADIEVGYPETRTERWCRIRRPGDKRALLLCHPSSLRECQVT